MARSGSHRPTRSSRGMGIVSLVTATTLAAALISAGLSSTDWLAPRASAVSCPTGTQVGSSNTCEAIFTSSGSFTMPANVSQIEALIVGSGGKSLANTGYAGGGGEVQLVTLANAGNLTITVGTSGAANPGDDSSVTQAGGSTSSAAGGGNGTNSAVGSGGGTGANKGGDGGNGTSGSSSARNGGSAIQVDTLASGGSLFDGVTDWYGGGGAGAQYTIATACLITCTDTYQSFASGTPGTRAGSVANTGTLPATPAFGDPYPVPVMTLATANSGGGAGATNWGGNPAGTPIGDTLGAAGIVIVRYVRTSPAPPAPAPPAPVPADDGLVAVAVATPSPTPTPSSPWAVLDPTLSASNPSTPRVTLPPGGSSLFIGGAPEFLSVSAAGGRIPASLSVSGQGWDLFIEARGDTNRPVPLGPQGSLVLESPQGSRSPAGPSAFVDPSTFLRGNGYQPNTPIRFYLLPGTYIGQLMANASGSYTGSLAIPANLQAGSATLQVNGFAQNGSVRSLNLGVTVSALKPVRMKVATTRVFFAPLSAELSPASKRALRKLVRRTGRDVIKTLAYGYVQPTARIDNDRSLSVQRAQMLVRFLRSIGVQGSFVSLGKGTARQQGASARRVDVKVVYR